MSTNIQFWRGLEADRLSVTPDSGEPLFTTDEKKLYIGDGVTPGGVAVDTGGGGGGAVDSVNGQTGVVVLDAGDVGLGNVDNTSDANKPISTATQTALNAKATTSALTAHTSNTSNPHSVTKAQVGLSNVPNTDFTSAVAANTAKISYTDAAKVATIETNADVTDTANVTAAGALMDSEVANLSQVKNFDSSDYATAAQGSLASTALQPSDNISELTNNAGYLTDVDIADINATGTPGASTFLRGDGTWSTASGGGGGSVTSVAVSGSDGIEVDSGSPITTSGTIALGVNASSLRTHINVENGADVTDTANVTAAGALMDSEVANLAAVKSFDPANYQPIATNLTNLAALTDPNADRILFWDDSAGAYTHLTASTGLTLSGTSLTVRTSSSTQTGIVELATTAEATAGTDTARAVTAAGLTQFHSDRFVDEDDMTSDSATKAPSQQSVKAYVNNAISSVSQQVTDRIGWKY